MRTIATIVLASALLVSGCASARGGGNAQEELLRTDEAFSAAAAEGQDVDRVVSFWSDDATIAPAGAPLIVGKAAIRDYVAQSFATPGFRISWKTLEVIVSPDGQLGYTTAETTMTVPGADGKLMTLTARAVAIWRRDSSGDWKCVYDIWNHGA